MSSHVYLSCLLFISYVSKFSPSLHLIHFCTKTVHIKKIDTSKPLHYRYFILHSSFDVLKNLVMKYICMIQHCKQDDSRIHKTEYIDTCSGRWKVAILVSIFLDH